MHIRENHKRLASLWGDIDRQHNMQIQKEIVGSRVLDIGCGYGSLVNHLTKAGLEAKGINCDNTSIEVANSLYPDANIVFEEAEKLQDYSEGAADTIILKDSFHHLLHETDSVASVFEQFARILRPSGRIIIFDPNPTRFVRFARKIIGHVDPCGYLADAKEVLNASGFHIKSVKYYETIGLPLSGGYVGPRWVPNVKIMNRAVGAINDTLSRSFQKLGLGPGLCWRYTVSADLSPEDESPTPADDSPRAI